MAHICFGILLVLFLIANLLTLQLYNTKYARVGLYGSFVIGLTIMILLIFNFSFVFIIWMIYSICQLVAIRDYEKNH